MFKRTIAILAIVFCLALPAAAGTHAFTDTTTGYSIAVPEDWVAVNPSDLDDLIQRNSTPGSHPLYTFVAGFQPKSHAAGLDYPYVLIQATHYPANHTIENISEDDLKSIAAGMSGVNGGGLRKSLSLQASDIVEDDAMFSKTVYFTDPPGFRLNMKLHPTAGAVRAVIYGFIGKDRLISVNLYGLDDDFDNELSDFQGILNSFHLTPEEQAPLSDTPTMHLLRIASIVAVVGGFAGLLLACLKRPIGSSVE